MMVTRMGRVPMMIAMVFHLAALRTPRSGSPAGMTALEPGQPKQCLYRPACWRTWQRRPALQKVCGGGLISPIDPTSLTRVRGLISPGLPYGSADSELNPSSVFLSQRLASTSQLTGTCSVPRINCQKSLCICTSTPFACLVRGS